MGGAEQERREAVMRVLSGEPPSKVASDLGRTDRWVRKWVARYDPADATWAEERSRAPKTQAHRTEQETEELVLKIRQRLQDNPWAGGSRGDRLGDGKAQGHPAHHQNDRAHPFARRRSQASCP